MVLLRKRQQESGRTSVVAQPGWEGLETSMKNVIDDENLVARLGQDVLGACRQQGLDSRSRSFAFVKL